jgi:hypothetical protein
MTSIVASADSYELTKVPFFQKIGNMAISGVIYTVVAVVGVVIGVAGATYMFEQTEIEPKIKEVAKKIGEGVENIKPETVAQVTAAITDLGNTGNDVVNAVMSLSEGGDAQGGNAESKNAEGGIELSDMSKKGLPLSVDSLTAATTGAINQKAEENANAVIAEQTKAVEKAVATNVNEQTKAVEKAVATNVNEQTKAAQTLFTDKSKAGQSLLADNSKAVEESVKQTKTLQEAAGEQTKASAKLGSDAMQQYELKKKTMSNISKPDFKLDYSQAASIAAGAAGAAGGGKKTKNKRTKLTKVDSNVKKSVKRQRKPRTKKCLIEKDNKMYMSFCI